MAPLDEVGVLLRLGDCMGCACGRNICQGWDRFSHFVT